MWEKFKAFWATDLGESLIHCSIGAASGIHWVTFLITAGWFHGREMGQHDDKLTYITNPWLKPWVFIEAYGPTICGLLVLGALSL